jgi:hypothetical protein
MKKQTWECNPIQFPQAPVTRLTLASYQQRHAYVS